MIPGRNTEAGKQYTRFKEDTLQAYRALELAVDEGLIRHLGISNAYDADDLRWLVANARIKVHVVQNKWNEETQWDWSVYEICQANGIQYQLYGVLKSEGLLTDPHLLALAQKHKISPQQAIYKLCQLWNMTPLCGSTSSTHMREALAVEAIKDIDEQDEDVKEIWETLLTRHLGVPAILEEDPN
ncbi:hypothetical protein IAT40_007994 [Kwoniella sp. CBS 6097]